MIEVKNVCEDIDLNMSAISAKNMAESVNKNRHSEDVDRQWKFIMQNITTAASQGFLVTNIKISMWDLHDDDAIFSPDGCIYAENAHRLKSLGYDIYKRDFEPVIDDSHGRINIRRRIYVIHYIIDWSHATIADVAKSSETD